MSILSRRSVLAGVAAGGAGIAGGAVAAPTFGNPDMPPQGAMNALNRQSLTDPGPKNPALASQFPSFQEPVPTDVDGMPLFWASFNNAHKRVQNGGWAREVTQDDFAISEAVSSVNMRLAAGGIRELHWHQQAEWAYMLDGGCRITALDAQGRPQVQDLRAGDLWYFPPGLPHSLQGLGPDGAEFLLVFDNGKASEFNTLLLTDWMAHTPPDVLALNFGVPTETFSKIPLENLWIFQGAVPGPLADAQASAASNAGAPSEPFTSPMASLPANKATRGGSVRIVDSSNFPVSKTIAAALVTVHPGGMRELHWHPNADEWQFYIAGEARMTVFNTGPKAQTADFRPGDIGYIKKSLGHYIQNTGSTDLQFLEIFKADRYAEVSLTDWLVHTPPEMVAATLGIDPAVIRRFPQGRPDVVPV
jgi:oxalate decarboxylase